MGNEGKADAPRAQAGVRRSGWPGWIWAIPIAALMVVGWLGIRTLTSGGQDIMIRFGDVHGLEQNNSNVVYRGINVGKVTSVALTSGGDGVMVTAHIQEGATKFLRAQTRFWLRGANPSLSNLSSLGAVLSGPSIVMEPGPGKETTHFIGEAYKPVAPTGTSAPQRYEVSFQGAVGGLKKGDPVKLRGFTLGEVDTVGFHFDATAGTLATSVTIALYPSLVHLKDTQDPNSPAALSAAIHLLIERGLRARLERDPPLIGSYRVALDMIPGASAVTPAVVNGLPQIPAAPEGGFNSIVSRLNKVPVDQIAQSVLGITEHVGTLVASPKLKDAIAQLDATLKEIHDTAASAGPMITKLVETLRRTAGQLDQTARSADNFVAGATSQDGLKTTMREISEAARSVRELANYLDRHPGALIRGRTGD